MLIWDLNQLHILQFKGIEGDYVACFATKEAWGPNFDYEAWIEYKKDYLKYHPIVEYKDEEGFKFISHYYECSDIDEISFTYFVQVNIR